MSTNCVIGRHGFIGSRLAKALGDVTTFPTKETKVIYHFGSYTHPVFDQNPEYFIRKQLDDFNHFLSYCYDRGILFVYPSSALVYEQETQFSSFKKSLELLAKSYKTRTLGLRIFPVYGEEESHTVISMWCRDIIARKSPKVYGDGNQSRDFIYIGDVVDQILQLTSQPIFEHVVQDIGTGHKTKFNDIISMINLQMCRDIKPEYVQRPGYYPEGIVCPDPLPVKTPISVGIAKILRHLEDLNK